MSKSTRNVISSEQKAKVAIQALKNVNTTNEIGQEHGVHPTQVNAWKKTLQDNASQLFDTKRGVKSTNLAVDNEALYAQIGRLKMEVEWLKKKL